MLKGWASATDARRRAVVGRTRRRFMSLLYWLSFPGQLREYSGDCDGLIFIAGMTRRGAWGASRRVARWGVTRVFCDGANELAEARTTATTKPRIFRLVAVGW